MQGKIMIWETFLLVIFILKKFRQNRRDVLLFDLMLEVLASDELEEVALSDILYTFTFRLCCPCWVVWIITWVGRFL